MATATKKDYFWAVFPRALGVFVFLSGVLFWYDLLPSAPTSAQPTRKEPASLTASAHTALESAVRERFKTKEVVDTTLPVRVVAERVGLNAPLQNPASTDVAVLDRALLSGAVVYPGSAPVGGKGNLLFFGHSSRLPVVKNQAFRAFNPIEKIIVGDTVVVYTEHFAYRYRVRKADLTKADETVIYFNTDEHLLTLATCDTLGEKEDRFVVEAVFEDRFSL